MFFRLVVRYWKSKVAPKPLHPRYAFPLVHEHRPYYPSHKLSFLYGSIGNLHKSIIYLNPNN